MKQYQVRSTFISTKGLLILCILMLVNVVVAGILLSGSFQDEWFSLLLSICLLVFLVGILFESRKVKEFKVSRQKIIVGAKVINSDDLLTITITHKQIVLTWTDNMNFRKSLLIRMVNSEELKPLTEDLMEFAKEHRITLDN